MANAHFAHVSKQHILDLSFERDYIHRNEYDYLTHANTFNNNHASYKSDYIHDRHWTQIDDRTAELTAMHFGGLYMDRDAYFDRDETWDFYERNG